MVDNDRDPYLYPDVPVLRNRLNIRDPAALDFAESDYVTFRIRQGAPLGRFDLAHLQRIHAHLFQDVYDWAGEIRTVEISKDGHTFQFCRFIAAGMADVRRRLAASDYLRNLRADAFADQVDVNYVHPFREGNGRTQLQYLKQLGASAGHDIDLTRLADGPGRWIDASRASHKGDYAPMAEMIRLAIVR